MEASLVIPVVLMVVFTCVYFCFHTHNRDCLIASCTEQAISGHEQEKLQLPAAGELTVTRSDLDTERTCAATTSTQWYTGETYWNIKVSEKYEKVKPVSFTRRAHAVIELVEGE